MDVHTVVRRGFTLIELLIVMAILAVLVSVVVVKTGAFKRIGSAYDVRRRADINQLQKALVQAIIKGLPPPKDIPKSRESARWICQYSIHGLQCINLPGVDLSYLVPDIIPSLPTDPQVNTGATTGYKIYQDGSFFIIFSPTLEAAQSSAASSH